MQPTVQGAGVTRAPKARFSRAMGLWVALFVVASIFGWRTVGAHSARPHDALHGDGEDAVVALEATLKPMPAASRLPFLLRSANDDSAGLRYAAIDSLARYRTPEAIAAIENGIRDSASIVRQRSIETLHTVDHDRGLLLLLAALRDHDSWIREFAAVQLTMPEVDGSHGDQVASPGTTSSPRKPKSYVADRRAVPSLIRALDDPDDVVSRTSVTALVRLTGGGQTYRTVDGASAKQRALNNWKSWWAVHSGSYRVPAPFADVRPIQPERSDPAPDFNLRDVDGETVSLASQRGRLTLVNFWGTWCPPCRAEIPGIERVYEQYQSRGLTVVGAAVSESNGADGLRKWCHDHGLTYRQVLATPELQEDFGDVKEVPVSVLIDRKGRVRYRWEGDRDYDTFRAAVERLLAEP